MMAQYRTVVSALVWSLGATGVPTLAMAQEPVSKPTNLPVGTGDRLVMPRNVAAVQLHDGRIQVTWSPVAGATAYSIVRSVPPDAAQPITPNVKDTVYFDSKVTAGKTYYYVISAVNETATGMKAGAPPVRATRSFDISGSHLTPTNVTARYDASSNSIVVSWQAPSLSDMTFIVQERRVPGSGWVEVGRRVSRPPYIHSAAPPGTRWQFQVRAQDAFGVQSPWALSNEVQVDSSTASTTLPTGPLSTTGPAGTVSVTIGSTMTMRVGTSASASSALGGASASRWASLDEGIATVDGSGTVTARAAGRARLLAIAPAADGAVRVTLVQVAVEP